MCLYLCVFLRILLHLCFCIGIGWLMEPKLLIVTIITPKSVLCTNGWVVPNNQPLPFQYRTGQDVGQEETTRKQIHFLCSVQLNWGQEWQIVSLRWHKSMEMNLGDRRTYITSSVPCSWTDDQSRGVYHCSHPSGVVISPDDDRTDRCVTCLAGQDLVIN